MREVHISADLIETVNAMVRHTRPVQSQIKFVNDWVRWGAGPRAGQAMILTAKARALLHGNFSVTLDDIKKVAFPVLRHRILMNFKAEAEGVTPDQVTEKIIEAQKSSDHFKKSSDHLKWSDDYLNMNAQIKELLKPEILNSINGMELIARIIVEGFMSGSNKSQTIGAGQEFSQYRNYEPGDDLRQLDWKMYARSERYYIKQAEIETNITVKFMIDASNSMSYSEHKLSKLQYAKVLTAALAYLARKQSDSFGLFTVNNKHIQIVEPRFEQQQFLRFLNALIEVKSEGTWEAS